MKKITVISSLALALVLPASALGAPQPDRGDKRAAQKECRELRGTTDATHEAFRTLYRNFGACVSSKAREEAREEQSAHRNAAKECKAEREADAEAFKTTYGGRANAFGKCVSQKAKEKESEADEQDQQDATEFKNAAKECAAEREANAETFKTTYGTENANYKNAFGKCVSKKARENETEQQPTEA
jgi:hypothetical protein